MFSKILKSSFSIAVLLGFLLISKPAKAQLDQLDAFYSVALEDVEILTRAYLEPLATGLSTSLNSGWVTKAEPTKTLGFSLQFRTAVAAVPSGAQSFDMNDLDLAGDFDIVGTSSSTISGDDSPGQSLQIAGSGTNLLTAPAGTGFNYVPIAMIQGNVGLIKGTDLTLRYIPETAVYDYGDIAVFGVGVKHGINQWLPGGKLLPVDLSVMAAFTSVQLNADLTGNQTIETTTNGFVLNALVGKSLPFLSAYAGFGYQTGSFELEKRGEFNIGGATITDPISYSEDSDAAAHLLGGLQFKIAVFRIYAEATLAEYATYNVGLGIGLRN